MIDKVVEEMKQKPFTMLLLVGLYAAVTMLWLGKAGYASAGEMAAVKQQLTMLSADVKRGNLETQLRNTTSELFNTEQKVADIRAANKRPDQIYFDRLAALRADKERLERELAAVR